MKTLFSLLLLATLSFNYGHAQTADEVIEDYLEAIGGVEAWKEVSTSLIKGKMTTQGMDLPFENYSKAPNKEYVTTSVMGKEIIEAFDGTTVWRVNPFMESTEPQEGTEEENSAKAEKNF